MKTIGERLKHARESVSLQPTDVAAHYSVSRQAVTAYETGEILPGAAAIIELCHAYSCTADWLLGIPPVRNR